MFSGQLADVVSPSHHLSDLAGADLQVHRGERLDGQPLRERVLYYLGVQRADASFASQSGARLLLIGGPPFPDTILMWWNFVARTPEEIRDARDDWENGRRFGDVKAYKGHRLRAPELVRLARPNPVS